ncbi:MAG: M16 family metallopeptidase, partial [bacterium]
TRKIGTTNYKKEVPLMIEMEAVARQIRDRQIRLQEWRYEEFESFVTEIKAQLPDEIRKKGSQDEVFMWKELLRTLPTDTSDLPDKWKSHPWMLIDKKKNYWNLYREILILRIKLTELEEQHKKLITEGEPLDAIYDVYGSAMHNAFTTNDQTTYMVGLPSNCLELFLFLEADRFQNPVFRQFYREREVVMEELRMRESEPENKLYKALLTTAFDAHPYGKPVIGWLSDIRSTLRSDMEDFYFRFYAPNNCQLTIVGDVKAEEVFRLAKKYFSSWKKVEVTEELITSNPPLMGERRVTMELEAEPRVFIGYHVPVPPHPDAYPIAIIEQILGSGKTSRLYKSLFQLNGVTAQPPGVWRAPASRYPNLFVISGIPKSPHSLNIVEEAIYKELEQIKDEPVSDWELEKIKNQYRMSEITRLRSNQSLAFTLSSFYVNRKDWRAYEEDMERLMAVTPEDIQRVAQKYFTKSNRVVVRCEKRVNDLD